MTYDDDLRELLLRLDREYGLTAFEASQVLREAKSSAALDRDETHTVGEGHEREVHVSTAVASEETRMTDKETPKPGPVTGLYPIPTDEYTTNFLITPAVARTWLAERNTHNRHVKGSAVTQYAAAMKSGQWYTTGDPIKFSRDGVLLDGQNRLAAIVASDSAQRADIRTGLETESQRAMDQGVPRTVADMLGMEGVPNRSAASGGAIIALRMAADDLGPMRQRFRTPEVMKWLQDHPEFSEFAKHAAGHWKKYDIGPGTLAYMMWRLHEVDAGAADEFFRRWREADTGGRTTPLGALVERIKVSKATRYGYRHGARGLTQYHIVAFTFRAWNAHVTGQKVERFQTSKDGKRIGIPKPLTPTGPVA